MATNVHRSRTEPYLSVENNIRVSDHEVIWCFVCHDEATVISNDGTKGLCDVCFEQIGEAIASGGEP